jgi:uncharacterized protein (DUF1501 family)
MSTNRREFLISGLSAGATAPFLGAGLSPGWLQAKEGGAEEPLLIVVQARGGYDLFNMLVPADSSEYYNARTTIGIPKAQTLGEVQVGSQIYWHPEMAPFKALFDAGELALILDIGYPNPNLSHFESEKKWYAGDPAVSNLISGWLGRYLRKAYTGTAQIPAMNIEAVLNPAFTSALVPVLTSAASFAFQYDAGSPADNAMEALAMRANAMWVRQTPHPNLQYAVNATLAAMDDSVLLQSVGSSYTPLATYPAVALGNALSLAARYITGGLPTHIYYASSGGFDNHANLANAAAPTTGTFASRLAELVGSIKAFLDDLQAHGVTRKVLVMVWSEFSRRFGQNGSIGTDHGHGGVAMLAGKHVNGGLYGTYPNLTLATQPYYNYYPRFGPTSTDFRSLYATVLERWLGVASAPLLGSQFQLINAL